MAENFEPFHRALSALRHQLMTGELAAGERVTAKLVAENLRLSATPVREALSRLAGEGLLTDHRGEGFFVPWLSAADIAALYRQSEQTLLIAQRSISQAASGSGALDPGTAATPTQAVMRLFESWAAEAESLLITGFYGSVNARLASARRMEAQVIANLEAEALELASLAPFDARRRRPEAIRTYHRRRVAQAAKLAAFLQASTRAARI